MASHTDILDFWFSDRIRKQWFSSTPALDQEIKERFEPFWEKAAAGELDAWRESAEGCLALVIIFDQLPLNMYRGDAKSFSTEAASRDVAHHAIHQGFDKELNKEQQAFLYMPFMHSELLEDQDLAVELFSAAGLEGNLHYAKHHRSIVQRFGRFPHRNAILGRESTPEELEYLSSDKAFKG